MVLTLKIHPDVLIGYVGTKLGKVMALLHKFAF